MEDVDLPVKMLFVIKYFIWGEMKRLITFEKLLLALVYLNMQINLRCVSPVRSLAFL